jgi:hypothetical protein
MSARLPPEGRGSERELAQPIALSQQAGRLRGQLPYTVDGCGPSRDAMRSATLG